MSESNQTADGQEDNALLSFMRSVQDQIGNVASELKNLNRRVSVAEQSISAGDGKSGEIRTSSIEDHTATSPPAVSSFKNSQSIPHSMVNQFSVPSNNDGLRLPTIQLIQFSGSCLKWQEFWDVYNSSVHQKNISPVQKFSHLKGLLRAEAAIAIEGLSVTNENYQIAIDILLKKFGNKQKIVQSLYNQLDSLKFTELKITVAKLEALVRQLSAQGEDIHQPSIVNSLLRKIPRNILLEIGRLKMRDVPWTMTTLINALGDIVNLDEETDDYRGVLVREPSNSFVGPKLNSRRTHQNVGNVESRGRAEAPQNREKFVSFNSTKPPPKKWDEKKILSCIFCEKDHFNDKCQIVKLLSDRVKILREAERCFLCLRKGHSMKDCFLKDRACFHCKIVGRHNRALCPSLFQSKTKPGIKNYNVMVGQNDEDEECREKGDYESEHEDPDITQNTVHSQKNMVDKKQPTFTESVKSRLLTKRVTVKNGNRNFFANAFIDCGCQRTFISEELARKLKTKTLAVETLKVHTFATTIPQTIKSKKVEFDLKLSDGKSLKIKANVTKKITNPIFLEEIPKIDQKFLETNYPEILKSQNLTIDTVFRTEILIGQDYAWELMQMQQIKLPSGLFLFPTKIGHIIGGGVQTDKLHNYHAQIETEIGDDIIQLSSLHIGPHENSDIPDMEQFWRLEGIGIQDSPDANDDQDAMTQFEDSIEFRDGRYYVGWPWKEKIQNMPTNYGQAFGRFRQLVKRLSNDNELLQKCSKIIQDQFDKGVIEEVTDKEPSKGVTRYLSWHPVITPDKTTTKVRLVYDASARPSGKEQSLNDLLNKGPTLLPDLCGLLLRFREPKVGLIADIEKAFLQIGLHESDKDCTRFLWFKDPTKPTIENNLAIYRFARVAFGVISSPFLLNATVKHHLESKQTDVCDKIADSLYVDNLVCGTDSIEEANALYTESKEVFTEGAMNLREWLSNSTEFQEFLPEKDRVENRTTKVLGLSWNSEEDTLKLGQVKTKEGDSNWTKRKVLQTVASLFDPLGFASPVSLTGKLFIQKLWSTNHQWDDPISADLTTEWELILKNYENVNKIDVPRYLGVEENSSDTTENYELHTFVDASKDAFCAVVYLHIDSKKNGKKIHLLFSKSRIAPKKVTSLPRLELLAALIGIRALKFVEEHMKLKIERKFLWSDSEIVLHWIKSNKPLKVFVENRIREIRKAENTTFCYVNTTEYPADIGSRGCSADELLLRKLWWKGPNWLLMSESDWPIHNLPPLTPELLEEITKEVRTTAELTMSAGIRSEKSKFIRPDDHSSLTKLLRVTAYCLKFIRKKLWNKLRKETQEKFTRCHNLFSQKSHPDQAGDLTPEEIRKARMYWDR